MWFLFHPQKLACEQAGLLLLAFTSDTVPSTLHEYVILGSIPMNKVSEGDGISVELFQILKDDAVKVLHSTCQQIWKT